jgi:hypothetical protein
MKPLYFVNYGHTRHSMTECEMFKKLQEANLFASLQNGLGYFVQVVRMEWTGGPFSTDGKTSVLMERAAL